MMVSPLLPRIPDMTIEFDASNMGWEACQGEVRTGVEGGIFEPHQLSGTASSLPSGSQCFAKQIAQHYHTVEDGQCNGSDLCKQNGGTRSQALCNLAISLWDWSLQQNIYLSAEHLPGEENTSADQESRSMRDRCDWMLNPLVFNQIQS